MAVFFITTVLPISSEDSACKYQINNSEIKDMTLSFFITTVLPISSEDSACKYQINNSEIKDMTLSSQSLCIKSEKETGSMGILSLIKFLYIDLKVRKNAGDPWQDSISTAAGDTIEFKIEVRNVGILPRWPLVMVVLPPLLDYVTGSANPAYTDYYIDGDDEIILWNNFHVPGLQTRSITYNAKIIIPGFGEVNAQVIPDLGSEVDYDTVQVYGINNPPYQPTNPNPENGVTGVPVNAVLSWTGGDPDGDSVKYDVYFGTINPPPKFMWNTSDTFLDPPGNMNYNTTYYWKIIAWDEWDVSNVGPVWHFTTNNPPNCPSNPNPANGSTDVDIDANLSWIGGDPDPGDTVMYDIYFGSINPPPKIVGNQSDITYDPGTMDFNTTYYWKIISWDNHNASSSGPIWHFITKVNNPPNCPSNPNPANGSTDVDIDANLSWIGGDPDPGDTVMYDIYFGSINPPPKIVGNQSDITYDPGTMDFNTTYYWKIISWDNHNASSSGPIWHFTTELEPNFPPVFSYENPNDGAIDILITLPSLTVLIEDSEGDSFNWTIETSPDIGSNGSTDDSNGIKTCTVSGLNYNTNYTWYVNATDSSSGEITAEIYTFTTEQENHPPNKPINPSPWNGEPGVSTNPTLSVDVSDPDNDVLTVIFYNASNQKEIGRNTDVPSGNRAEVTWSGLSEYATYFWYAVADDGEYTNQSDTWNFTTGEYSPPLENIFIVGLIDSKVTEGDYIRLSGKLIYSNFSSVQFLSGEEVIISKDYLGYVGPRFIIGFFKAAIV